MDSFGDVQRRRDLVDAQLAVSRQDRNIEPASLERRDSMLCAGPQIFGDGERYALPSGKAEHRASHAGRDTSDFADPAGPAQTCHAVADPCLGSLPWHFGKIGHCGGRGIKMT